MHKSSPIDCGHLQNHRKLRRVFVARGPARTKQHVIGNPVALMDFSGPLERLLSRLFPITEEHSLSAPLLSLPPRRIMTVQEKHGVTLISTFHRGEPRCTHSWHFLFVSLLLDVGRHMDEMTGFVTNTAFPSLLYRLPFCPPPGFTSCSLLWMVVTEVSVRLTALVH